MRAIAVKDRLVERMPGGWTYSQLTDATHGAHQGSLVRSVCDADGKVLAHTHDVEQITMFQSGEGYMAVGKDIVAVKAGSVVVVPAGTPHGVWNPNAKRLEYLAFCPATNVQIQYLPPNEAAVIERYMSLFHNAGDIAIRTHAIALAGSGADI
ncbi:MAG: cupin domain-containing protein [Phycisphaerales bacterium]|nr:cupin domain-containing protein [Phycisphaerales bacterium]